MRCYRGRWSELRYNERNEKGERIMKRRSIIAVVCVLLLTVALGHGYTQATAPEPTLHALLRSGQLPISLHGETLANSSPLVYLELVDVDDEGVHYILHNDSDSTIEYGNPYALELRTDSGWRQVPLREGHGCFQSIRLILPAHQQAEGNAWPTSGLYAGPGQYRLLKTYDFEQAPK